ncbi:MAG: CHAT domain-containing protein, partial [Candidatus Eisenbacteria bacterium]
VVWGYVVKRHGPVRWVRLAAPSPGAGAPSGLAELRRVLLRDSAWPLALADASESERMGRRVWRERLEPLLPALVNIQHLIVLDSKGMEYVPVESWVDGRGRPAVERFAISYAPSASVYALLHARGRTRPLADPERALVVGDPRLTEPALSSRLALQNAMTSSRVALSGFARGRASGPTPAMRQLTWARSELVAVSSRFERATVLTGVNASEAKVRSALGTAREAPYSVVHFAAHTLQNRHRQSPVSLLLEGTSVNRPPSEPLAASPDDGWLTSDEVGALEVPAEMVTLSACRTAGFYDFGGFVGLGDAFLRAGASCVVMSLWEVDDHATELLMRTFYGQLSGLRRSDGNTADRAPDRALALARAKCDLRNYTDADGRHPYSHPAYWSGFILVGDSGH